MIHLCLSLSLSSFLCCVGITPRQTLYVIQLPPIGWAWLVDPFSLICGQEIDCFSWPGSEQLCAVSQVI